MSDPRTADSFIVINGPEDGAEFPLVRAPFSIGYDRSCAVNVTLDSDVDEFHAHVTVVSEGYCVRALRAAPVFVNGKRARLLKSRTVRNGGTVRVGNTVLLLECSPSGLASRSRGVGAMSDFHWAARIVLRNLANATRELGLFGWCGFRRLVFSKLGIIAILVMLYLFFPSARYQMNRVMAWIFDRVAGPIFRMIAGFFPG